jgi:hypothetical protein
MPWPARIQNGWIQPDALDALNFTTDQKVGGSSPSERASLTSRNATCGRPRNRQMVTPDRNRDRYQFRCLWPARSGTTTHVRPRSPSMIVSMTSAPVLGISSSACRCI